MHVYALLGTDTRLCTNVLPLPLELDSYTLMCTCCIHAFFYTLH